MQDQMRDHEKCPQCGYPDVNGGKNYKGIYTTGERCTHCGFFRQTAADPDFATMALASTKARGIDWAKYPRLKEALSHRPSSDLLDEALELAAAMRAQGDKEADERWCAAMKAADWDGGVFHHEGRIYPWPRGFVPDCPATWEVKVDERLRERAVVRLSDALGLVALLKECVGTGTKFGDDGKQGLFQLGIMTESQAYDCEDMKAIEEAEAICERARVALASAAFTVKAP